MFIDVEVCLFIYIFGIYTYFPVLIQLFDDINDTVFLCFAHMDVPVLPMNSISL